MARRSVLLTCFANSFFEPLSSTTVSTEARKEIQRNFAVKVKAATATAEANSHVVFYEIELQSMAQILKLFGGHFELGLLWGVSVPNSSHP
jgi:hypothetical protein